MSVIVELAAVFFIALTVSGAYQLRQRARDGRAWTKVAHFAVVFGLAAVVLYFVFLIVTDVADLRPEPPG